MRSRNVLRGFIRSLIIADCCGTGPTMPATQSATPTEASRPRSSIFPSQNKVVWGQQDHRQPPDAVEHCMSERGGPDAPRGQSQPAEEDAEQVQKAVIIKTPSRGWSG